MDHGYIVGQVNVCWRQDDTHPKSSRRQIQRQHHCEGDSGGQSSASEYHWPTHRNRVIDQLIESVVNDNNVTLSWMMTRHPTYCNSVVNCHQIIATVSYINSSIQFINVNMVNQLIVAVIYQLIVTVSSIATKSLQQCHISTHQYS